MTRSDLAKSTKHLEEFLAPHQNFMGRKETQAHIQTYLTGLVGDVHKKNAEAIALEIGKGEVRALQRMLVSSKWDQESMIAQHQLEVAAYLGSGEGILIIDDTGFRKRGNKSCGAGRQYSGTLGKVENCQVGVFLSYAAPDVGHTFLDRRLYLKKEWFTPEWAPLRKLTRIPEEATFRTKPELALEMILEARKRKVPHRWISMDAGYGEIPALLDALDKQRERYAAAVPKTTQVWTEYPRMRLPKRKGKRGRPPTKPRLLKGSPNSRQVEAIAKRLPEGAFKSYIFRQGEKGPLAVEVAGLRVWNRRNALPDRQEWLLIIRRVQQKPETKYVLSNAPANAPQASIVYAALARWSEEQCFEQGKDDLGLDEYQTKMWEGWHRHTALVMLAHSFLTKMRILGKKRNRASNDTATARQRSACFGG